LKEIDETRAGETKLMLGIHLDVAIKFRPHTLEQLRRPLHLVPGYRTIWSSRTTR
jgi:hypothetical protein